MTITYIETAGITNDWLRAAAGAHRLCVGYPDGVPETWRTPSACAGDATECRVGRRKTRGKHFMDETREMTARGGAGGGAAYPEHELDPAALLGPAGEPVDGLRAWVKCEQEHGGALGLLLRGDWPDRDAAGDEEC